MDEAVRTPTQAVEELEASYPAFVEKLENSRATSATEVMGFFFRSQGNPRVAYAVEEFNGTITGQVAGLAALLAGCPAEQADQLAGRALEAMLFYAVPADDNIAFSLAAFEGHALPLIAFLSPDRRRETAGRYAKRNPPRRMLPNQKKLWKELIGR